MTALSSKGTDPTGTQPQISSGKGHMVNGNRQINITVILTVRPLPGERVITTGDNNNRGLSKPISRIGFSHFTFYFFISKNNEVPGLKITSGRRISGCFKHLENLLLFHRLILIIPHRIPLLSKLQKRHLNFPPFIVYRLFFNIIIADPFQEINSTVIRIAPPQYCNENADNSSNKYY